MRSTIINHSVHPNHILTLLEMICQQEEVYTRFGSTHKFCTKATVQAQMLELRDGLITCQKSKVYVK